MRKLFILAALLVAGSCSLAFYTYRSSCPDCGQFNCIYQEINSRVKCETDGCIRDAVDQVLQERNITDSATVKLIYAGYYL